MAQSRHDRKIVDWHYENMPMHYTEISSLVKIKNFHGDIFDICTHIDCGYTEPPRRGSSIEYPQSMLLSKNKKNGCTPYQPQFCYIKVGFEGVIHYTDMFS